MRHDTARLPCGRRQPAMPRRFAGTALLAALAAVGATAQAQAPERLYQVEVVVFTQPAGRSAELPPRRPVPLDERGAEQDHAGGLSNSLEPAPTAPPGEDDEAGLPEGFSPARQPRTLDAVARRLNTGEYRLLWHQAWVQPPVDGDGEALALLAALSQGPAEPELAGTISLSLGRFLHLGVVLDFDSAGGLEAQVRQRRRIRLGVEQYYDDPRIGVIAVVHAIEADPAQPSP